MRGAAGNYTADEWNALVDRYDHRCAYCGCEARLTVDHRVSLFKGGANSIGNILPACLPCNKRKAYRDEAEFRAEIAKDGCWCSTGLRQSDARGAARHGTGGSS